MNKAALLGTAIALLAPMAHAAPVATTTAYDDLTLTAADMPSAPAGKLLTLTVNGVEMPLVPGHYAGKVVLSVTDDIPVKYHDLPEHHFRAAAYVTDGALDPARSVTAALAGGYSSQPGVLSNAVITSHGERFNGIIVGGKGAYRIDHPVIDLVGNGGNDFAGFGAGIAARDQAQVTIDRPVIRTRGAIRTAIFVGGHSDVTVNDAEIEVLNGTLPADYKFTVDVGKMMEVPWMLGLSGNVRATNLVDQGTVTYNRSHIRAQGWGAMSTDDNTHVRMFVNDSVIETVDSGYGCYSIGDSVDTFSRSIVRAADVACIMAAQGSVTFTNGTRVHSNRYGIVMHSGEGGGTLTIDKGSVMDSAQTAILVKGLGTNVVVDGAQVSAGNGVILQSMENDDPFMVAMLKGEIPEGMTALPPGMSGPPPGAPKGPPISPDVTATFRNTTVAGDFYNARPAGSAMALRFENASVTGRISTSTVAPASGAAPRRATYQEVGHVVNTAAAIPGGKGLSVTLGAGSAWTVTGPSYLTALDIAPGAKLNGTLRVNGRAKTVKPGRYTGQIVLSAK